MLIAADFDEPKLDLNSVLDMHLETLRICLLKWMHLSLDSDLLVYTRKGWRRGWIWFRLPIEKKVRCECSAGGRDKLVDFLGIAKGATVQEGEKSHMKENNRRQTKINNNNNNKSNNVLVGGLNVV